MTCLYALDLDEAVVCACAYDPSRLPEVDARWLWSFALAELLRAMQAIHARGETVDFDAIELQLQGRSHLTKGGWWGIWGEWWAVMRPALRGRYVPWPAARDRVRHLAMLRYVREQSLEAAAAAEADDLRDAKHYLERALAVVQRNMPADNGQTAEAAE